MTRVAVTKLLLLVILAFIICLPEFFTLFRESKVTFLCLPHRTCVATGREVKKGNENGKTGKAEESRKDPCDPTQAADCEKWEQTDTSDSASNSWRDKGKMIRFMCETNEESYNDMLSSALKLHLVVSVKLQLSDAETLNITLYGRSNHTSLHLHPLEEEEEEEEEEEGKEGEDKGQKEKEASFCCLPPLLPTSESSNRSRCLLWLANQTVLTASAKEKPPWKWNQRDEWRCIFRIVWLVLLCVVLLAIVTVVVRQVYMGRHLCRNSRLRPVAPNRTRQTQPNDVQQEIANIPQTGGALHTSYGFQPWSGLSPIQEVDSRDDIETLLDGNADHLYNGNLHHRCHSSSVSENLLL